MVDIIAIVIGAALSLFMLVVALSYVIAFVIGVGALMAAIASFTGKVSTKWKNRKMKQG
jgi:hypothetical protein